MHMHRYLLRDCTNWDPSTSPRPLVFIHGLGLGLLQYHTLIAQLVTDYTDRPILILLQPQVSQNFFHPQFLKPYSRHQTAEKLALLLNDMGWVDLGVPNNLDMDELKEEKAVEQSLVDVDIPDTQRGVTIVSHSKYAKILSSCLYSWYQTKIYSVSVSWQWLVHACLDAEELFRDRRPLMLCGSRYILFMGRG